MTRTDIVPQASTARAKGAAVALAAVSLLLVLAGSAMIVGRASAAWTEVTETGRPGYLSLRSDPGAPHWSDLRPGDSAEWLIEASLADAEESTLRLELYADGALVQAGAMTVSIAGCSEPFTEDEGTLRCDGAGETVLTEAPLAFAGGPDAGIHPLLDLQRGAPRYLLVTLALPATTPPDAVAGATARIGVGLHAAGDDPDDPGPGLATTGAESGELVVVVILAAGMLGLGLSAVLWRRIRRRSDHGRT